MEKKPFSSFRLRLEIHSYSTNGLVCKTVTIARPDGTAHFPVPLSVVSCATYSSETFSSLYARVVLSNRSTHAKELARHGGVRFVTATRHPFRQNQAEPAKCCLQSCRVLGTQYR